MPEWLWLLAGIAGVLVMARVILRLFSRWGLLLVVAVVAAVVLQTGGIPI